MYSCNPESGKQKEPEVLGDGSNVGESYQIQRLGDEQVWEVTRMGGAGERAERGENLGSRGSAGQVTNMQRDRNPGFS